MATRHTWGVTIAALAVLATIGRSQDLPVAPAPRAVEDTLCYLEDYIDRSRRSDHHDPLSEVEGLEWHPTEKLERNRLGGDEHIVLNWTITYIGGRPPLIVQRPSLRGHLVGGSVARFYAFPPGKKIGRILEYFDYASDRDFANFIHRQTVPQGYHLVVRRGKKASGEDRISVADLKERLCAIYPAEFGGNRPPKLYVAYYHDAKDRGGIFDMWTGVVGRYDPIVVPDLATW